MPREPSDATQIRNLKARCQVLESSFNSAIRQRDLYRMRATKAEQEVAEWKARFDALLHRDQQ